MFKEGSNIEGVEHFSSKEKGKEYVEPLINFLHYIKKMLHQRSIFFYVFFTYVSGALRRFL
ncbi:hypothetical protein A4U60_20800 [Priestia endophytica]|nr:hypothetical protein A4U60_20800 [Priestia endophytica]